MGDRGGRKDKEKSQKQHQARKNQRDQVRQDKLPRSQQPVTRTDKS